MAKKKFTEGLESLFGETAGTQQMRRGTNASDAAKETDGKGRHPGKDFTTDLQSFLTEAFEDAFEEQLSQPLKERKKKKPIKALSGLDVLIRNTSDPQQQIEIEELAPRRITLTLDDQHLTKLREIARNKKTYLKEMIKEIVAEYVERYPGKK
ncbi:MAG: hypothetical protein R2828_07330 [Saprospiraceae bacterium]